MFKSVLSENNYPFRFKHKGVPEMSDHFDPSKEGRRVVTRFGQPNERQYSEDMQRNEERDSKVKDGKGEENKRS